jgi:2-aminoethylphosphonate-pyruvate transaminase
MGFRSFDEHLPEAKRGYIITAFYYPHHVNFNFETFYRKLSARGQVIYPGKVSQADLFRLGNIGDLHAEQCNQLVDAISVVLGEMHIPVPLHNV